MEQPLDVLKSQENLFLVYTNHILVYTEDLQPKWRRNTNLTYKEGKIYMIDDENFLFFENSISKHHKNQAFVMNIINCSIKEFELPPFKIDPIITRDWNIYLSTTMNKVQLLNLKDVKVIKEISPHKMDITSILKLGNGNILTTSLDKTMKLFAPDLKLIEIIILKDYVYNTFLSYEGYIGLVKELSISLFDISQRTKISDFPLKMKKEKQLFSFKDCFVFCENNQVEIYTKNGSLLKKYENEFEEILHSNVINNEIYILTKHYHDYKMSLDFKIWKLSLNEHFNFKIISNFDLNFIFS